MQKVCVETVGWRVAAAGGRTRWMVNGTKPRADPSDNSSRSIATAQKLTSHVCSARLKPAIEKAGSGRNLVCLLVQDGGSLQHDLERGQFGRLVLFKDVLQREFVQGSREYQAPVILRNLNLEPIVHELTASCAVGQGDGAEGIWIRLGKHDHVQPGNGVHEGMGRVDFDGTIEKSFDTSEETGPCQSGPKTRC